MNGSRSNSQVLLLVGGAHIAAYSLALAERQILVDGPQVEPVDDRQHLFDDPAHVAVFVFLRLVQKIRQLTDELERARHIFSRNWVSPSLPLRDVVRLSGGHHSTPGRWT